MAERNQQLIADLKDGPLSNYEWAVFQDCKNCYFCNQQKLDTMRELQEAKKWAEMCEVSGWCKYPFKHSFNEDTKPWTCKDWEGGE